jgi:hypothetical protein
MAELDLEARRVRMRAEIEDAMGRLVALDRNNPAHAAGAGDVVAVGDIVAVGNVVAIGNAAPVPPLPLVGGIVHPPLPPGPPPGQQGATPIRQPGRTPVATTSAAVVAAAAARHNRVVTPRPAATQHKRKAEIFDQRGILPPHMARLMQQQQARGNPTQGSCLSGFGGFQS